MLEGEPLHNLARLPASGDNCAIATRRIDAGTVVRFPSGPLTIERDVPEGHRFAVRPIAPGRPLLSWGLPFGVALEEISPGEYLCNEATRRELALRGRGGPPPRPNFQDLALRPYTLQEREFRPAPPLQPAAERQTFEGFRRPGRRGVGTRNFLVVLGTSSRTAAYSRLLAARMQARDVTGPTLDGVVAVAHTEGGERERPNNAEPLLRALAGLMVHPNVAAVLAVDDGGEAIGNDQLRRFARRSDYPLEDVPHHFLRLQGSLEDGLSEGERILSRWLERAGNCRRGTQTLDAVKLALQCGGSDAFSGVSANPLIAWVAREVIRHGGAANLAETDELIGAESYLLARVRDFETGRAFLRRIERFQTLAAAHGLTAEGNPSGGNRLRGLYNITLKSIGAAMKRHAEVRLERVIDYASPLSGPGLHFMDSPGNDLESVAGQVASGANLVLFTTGNGSVTNFPFVPTLKVVSTTRRYRLLGSEMDFDAGRLLSGGGIDELGRALFELAVATASGRPTRGERAGHWQVSIWRDWRQRETSRGAGLAPEPDAADPVPLAVDPPRRRLTFTALYRGEVCATELVTLILPTSLCSGQIARIAAERLNESGAGGRLGVSRAVALVHTEGCGCSGSEELYRRTMLGYLTHPNVAHALLLEHGCETMHNARLREMMREAGIDPARYGFASVQLDGGIERVLEKIETWSDRALEGARAPVERESGLGGLRVGLFSTGRLEDREAAALLKVVRTLLGCGASVVIPHCASLLEHRVFSGALPTPFRPGLGYGQKVAGPGLFVMDSPSAHAVETLSGLGATGVHLILARTGEPPLPAHPLVPVVQFSALSAAADLDLALDGPSSCWPDRLLELIVSTASRRYVPRYLARGYFDFQLSRGRLGLSM